ncbi:uncharacterized protein LOC124418638 [Lucilia cuprina]|uniref:uncharacterized protein LOC124418638 n=1 Tax=Lucilia cuprina TaxID=7375 RepID=UPI001F05F430|nr:uncharacterized protein LOC124418638 [Lucilia cuprina]
MTDKHSIQGDVTDDPAINFVEHELIPNFQRVSISGEDTSGVPLEDLERASTLIIQALEMRSRYMSISEQSFPTTTLRFLKTVHESDRFNKIQYEDRKSIAELIRKISLPMIHLPPRGIKRSLSFSFYLSFEIY